MEISKQISDKFEVKFQNIQSTRKANPYLLMYNIDFCIFLQKAILIRPTISYNMSSQMKIFQIALSHGLLSDRVLIF